MTPSTQPQAIAPGAGALPRPAARAAKARLSATGRLFISVMLIVIFEGAIRKWAAESSTLPLILLRDLLAMYLVVRAFTHGHFRRHPQLAFFMLAWSCCVIGWGLLQLVLGESSFPILLIGLRFWLLYLWFALAVAVGMSEHDYVAALRVLLFTLVLMAPLAALQHYSPPGAFVNRSLDVDEEDIFVVIAGVVRTTGTFSFTSGFTIFVGLCAPFALGAFEARKRKPSHMLAALLVFGGLITCSLVSGARASVIYIGAMVLLFLLGSLLFAPMRRKGWALLATLFVALLVVVLAFVFQAAIEATQERFRVAAENEDLLERITSIFLGEADMLDKMSWLGSGIGVGSNLAQYVQFSTRTVFIYGETEAARTLLEGGLLGVLFVLLKFVVIVAGLFKGLLLSMKTQAVFPTLVWVAIALALVTWPAIGQLSANGLLGILLALGLLSLRYPRLRLFG
jgi:hypothetical protein